MSQRYVSNRPPRVSWLMCTNRDDPLLRRAIDSCLKQSVTEFELILVVNGAEFKELADVLRGAYAEEPRVRVFATPIHYLNFSLSLGLHMAAAPFIARMDADDISHPERLARQLQYMDTHSDVVVLGSSYNLVDGYGNRHGIVNLPESDRDIRAALKYRNPICHPSVMLRKDAVLNVGGYLGGKKAEDYDLWLRLALDKSIRFANMREPLLDYNVDPHGSARASKEAYANVAAAQLRQFLLAMDIRWLVGAATSCGKAFFLAKRS